MGYVARPTRRSNADRLVVRGKPLSARVAALPFYPHAYYRGQQGSAMEIRYTKDHEYVRVEAARASTASASMRSSSSAMSSV